AARGLEHPAPQNHRPGGHVPAVAPSPDADPIRTHEGLLAEPARCGDLVGGLVPAEMEVGHLHELRATAAGAAIVHAGDEVAVLREHLVPDVLRAAPHVPDGLRARTAVHE